MIKDECGIGMVCHSFVFCRIPLESMNPQGPARHSMLSFKQFLTQQDDNIDETAAIASYNEYKTDFKRKQMEEFFEKHKDEDW